MTRLRRRRRSRLLGLVVLLVLCEVSLQLVGPLVQRAMSRSWDEADPDAPLSVLCVGDSNTYGLHLPRFYAYPALLQAALGRRYRHPVSVVNRGIPGQNSAQVAQGLEQDLLDLSPDLVLILAGINDTWNTDGQDLGLASWLGRLKLVRLVRVLKAGITTAGTFEIRSDDQGEIVIDRGTGSRRVNQGDLPDVAGLAGDALAEQIRAGLGRALTACRDAGCRPVLMTYAEYQRPFAEINAIVRALALQQDVLLIDHERDFQQHFADEGYASLMFDDHHPNSRGYRLMAMGADAVLEASGVVPKPLPPDEAWHEDLSPLDRPPTLALTEDGELELRGPSGWAYQLLMACAPELGAGFDAGGVTVPLSADGILALSQLEPSFSGRFDASGLVTLRVPPALRASADCPLAACLLLLRDDDRSVLDPEADSIAAASNALLMR